MRLAGLIFCLSCTVRISLWGIITPPSSFAAPTFISPACDLTVFVPDDLHLCDGKDFELCGDFSTPYSNVEYEWSENGNPTNYSLCETIDVLETTTFSLSVIAESEDNLIVNGDFENGDDGSFSTVYLEAIANCTSHSSGFLGCEGVYAVMDDPSDGHNNFAACGDHTSGNGNMMVINGASSLLQVWCQDVCVDPDAAYLFSAWAASVNPGSPAELQFSIDGNLIGSVFDLTSSTCEWEQFEADWQANGETTVEICVTNQNTAAGGNDFALDDLEFYQICEELKEFTVTVSDLETDIADPEEITCTTDEVDIFLDIFPLQPYDDIIWDTTDGDIVDDDGEIITVAEGGLYTVTVTDLQGCEFTDEVTVESNLLIPDLSIIASNDLDCNNLTVTLSSTTTADDPEYAWYDDNGTFVGDDDEVTLTSGGSIELVVIDEENGCENFEFIEVEIDTLPPSFFLQTSNPLTCNATTTLLTTSSTYDDVSWTSNLGLPISENNDSISVGAAGEYYATVAFANGCSHTDTITVIEIIPSFIFQVDYQDHINCLSSSSAVDISFDPTLFQLTWTGNASAYGNQTRFNIDSAGSYSYILEDSLGCTTAGSINITEDFTTPELLATTTTIECANPIATLSVPTSQFMVDWTLPDGSKTRGTTATTSQPGMAYYTISAGNGCSSLDSILVEASLDFPSVEIDGTELNCLTTQVELISTASSDVTGYTWIQPNGSELTTSAITVSQAGTYQLVVTNDKNCSSTAQYVLTENIAAPNLNPLPDMTLNCETTVVQPFAMSNDAYSSSNWIGASYTADSLTALFSEPGTYTLEVTGANGCPASTSLNVLIDTLPPDFSFTEPELLTCAKTSFISSLNIPAPYTSVSWTTPTGNTILEKDISIEEPGTFLIKVEGENGCSTTLPYVVERDIDFPEFESMATPLSCVNVSSEITSMSTDPNLEYNYYDGPSGINLGSGDTILVDGYNSIRVEATDDNGCTTASTIEIPQDTIPIAFEVEVAQLGCQVDGVLIELITSEAFTDIAIYNTTGQYLGDETTYLESPTNYEVVVTGENGCTENENITVTADTSTVDFTLSSELLTCQNIVAPITINAADEYDSAILLNNANEIIEEINYNDGFGGIDLPGNYTVVITNSNGCTSSQAIEVFQDDGIVEFGLSAGLLTCKDTVSVLDIITTDNITSGQVTNLETEFVWYFTQENTIGYVTTPGFYEVIVEGDNGCRSAETIEVFEDKNPALITNLELVTVSCAGQGIISNLEIIGNNPPYSLSLNGSAYEPIKDNYNIAGWGEQLLRLQDENGCISDTSIILTPIPELTGFIEPEITILQGESYELQLELNKTLSEIAEITWLPEVGLSCYDCLMPTFIGDEEIAYTIDVVDIYGCETSVQLRVLIEEIILPPKVYIPNVIDLTRSKPNNRFTIFSGAKDIELIQSLDIYDRWGSKVFVNSNFSPNESSLGWDGYFNGTPVLAGVYVYHTVVVYTNGEQEVFAGDVTLLR